MPESLFPQKKELTRPEKMRKSRSETNKLTAWAVKWLNDSGQFCCHRSSNEPGHRLSKKTGTFEAFDKDGNPLVFEYEKVEIFFKKNNTQQTILDISGFTTQNNTVVGGSVHVELEVKTGKDKLSGEQKERISQLKAAGCISFVFDSEETFLLQIKPFMKQNLAF